jgi:adenosylmethionine-8-amino-7-oxononanoate aminotransferase
MSDLSPRLRAFFQERGLLIRPLGNSIYVMPPYCIEDADLAAIWAGISEALDRF